MRQPPKYSLIDHTADCGVRFRNSTLKGLYEDAAFILTDLMVESAVAEPVHEHEILVDGEDPTDLLINWLREILFLFAGEDQVVAQVTMDKVEATSLQACVLTEPLNLEKHGIMQEIKAVTYHQARVEETSDGWECTVIFDV